MRRKAVDRGALLRPYLTAWRERLARQERLAERKRRSALKEAVDLAKYLARRYSVRRAAVVGSIMRPGDFRAGSDIDLIVWGLAPSALISAWVDVEKRTSFPVDLIAWEHATPRLRRTFLREGRVIFGAGAN